MISQEEIKALKELLSENKDSEIKISRSFLEDIVDYFENANQKKPTSRKKQPKIYYPNDEQLNQAFLDFIEMRNKIKKPMTDRAVTMAMNKLQKLAGTDNDLAVKILEQSVLHCWQDLYELKDDKSNRKGSGGIDWDNV